MLALFGSGDVRKSHSQFLKGLSDAGLEVDVKLAKDEELSLRNFDEWHYDHLLLLAPTASGAHGGGTGTRGKASALAKSTRAALERCRPRLKRAAARAGTRQRHRAWRCAVPAAQGRPPAQAPLVPPPPRYPRPTWTAPHSPWRRR